MVLRVAGVEQALTLSCNFTEREPVLRRLCVTPLGLCLRVIVLIDLILVNMIFYLRVLYLRVIRIFIHVSHYSFSRSKYSHLLISPIKGFITFIG